MILFPFPPTTTTCLKVGPDPNTVVLWPNHSCTPLGRATWVREDSADWRETKPRAHSTDTSIVLPVCIRIHIWGFPLQYYCKQ